ncbi:hypothetical protein [Conexibacter sp. DBS9H8]|uniref:hypothetical protein n=1 Tax=Conexibacter sp. DBS9H8 TaxID=2937801 RepID=UPI002010C178|nr:hypothetical protein [Conexibacter sp. DBS9H8]
MRRSVSVVVTVVLLLGAAIGGVLAQASGARGLKTAASRAPQRGRLLDANMRTPARRHMQINPSGWITSPNWPKGRPVGHVRNAYPAIAARNAARASEVLRVGRFHGIPGQFSTIQAALDAAHPGDVILIGPGDYKTTSVSFPAGSGGQFPAADPVTTPNLTIRGMNRNGVIIDDTTAGPPCNNITADQNFGPSTPTGPAGLNGLMVYKADNVSIENLTACNFPGGSGADGNTGNGIWWNGGANSQKIGGWGYYGAYITGTTLYYANETSAAQYGIFSSNWDGGMWDHVYASNMNDSGLYIGACQQQCNQVVNDAWSEFSALGYSGTNSGGNLVIENSQWDNNEDGFDTNSQNADEPSPQNGACPNNGISPITHTHSCWVFMDNWSHDNNNASAPAAGSAAAGPVGTGMTLSGGRNDTVMNNYFENNNAWGNAFVPYPDSGPPCTGGTGGQTPGALCIFDEYGDALIGNYYKHNGSYGNPTNGDFGFTNFEPNEPTDCFAHNTDASGKWTSSPSGLQQQFPTCNGKPVATPEDSTPQGAEFTAQVACDSGIGLAAGQSLPCPPGSHYPKITTPVLHELPAASELVTMPDPCGGVPANPWCSHTVTRVARCVGPRVQIALSHAVGERITSVTVTRNGRRLRLRRRGNRLTGVPLGAGRRPVRVQVTERMIVGHHRESVSFTRIYRRC